MMNTTTAKGGGMSDTPRTEKSISEGYRFTGDDGVREFVPADFARQLERELNEARAQNAKLVSDIYAHEHINTQMIFQKQQYRDALEEIAMAGTVAWARKRADRALEGK